MLRRFWVSSPEAVCAKVSVVTDAVGMAAGVWRVLAVSGAWWVCGRMGRSTSGKGLES